MRFSPLGPVMVEILADLADEEIDPQYLKYEPVRAASAAGNPNNIEKASKALVSARNPVVLGGQGVLYAEGCQELLELAELLQLPVMTTVEGKSAFPENHPLSLGTGAVTTTNRNV